MKTYSLKIEGNPYEVKILSVKGNQAEVEVNGMRYSVDVSGMGIAAEAAPKTSVQEAPRAAEAPKQAAPTEPKEEVRAVQSAAPAGANDVEAPMPGLILKILVSEGDSVKAGDPVLIMEAMKMENEVSSTADGTITKIHVKVGDNVTQGAALVSVG